MNIQDQLKAFYQKYKILVWPVVVAIVSLVVIVMVAIPQLLSYFNIRTELFAANNRLFNLQTKADTLSGMDVEVYKDNLDIALNALPADREVPQSLNILQDAINKSGMKIEAIKYIGTNSEMQTKKGSFQINLTVSGSFDSLKNLLTVIQNSPRVFRLTVLNSQTLKTVDTVQAEVGLEIFYQELDFTAGNPDAALPDFSGKDQQLLNELATKIQNSKLQTLPNSVQVGKTDPFD